jgi:cell division transport system ATP-binding protein
MALFKAFLGIALLVEFRDVSKIYEGDVRALQNVTLSVASGEFVFLNGPSGAGKSTMLQLIFRAETATSGSLLVAGVDVGRLPSSKVPALRRNLGIVFQDFKLLYDRTVYENVAFALEVLGLTAPEVKRETLEVLERVGLASKARLNPHKLSGGEQQRVAIARALAHDPQLVLADEPTGNLDAETSLSIFTLLQAAHERGATVIVASHNKNLIRQSQKRVIRLDAGRIIGEGMETDG